MTIKRINSNLPTTTKLELINTMLVELRGMIEQAKFDKQEITAIYVSTAKRKYLRDVSLGHTLATYAGWTHLQAESGYSIWKYSPTNYAYSAVNELYLDNIDLENRGQANSESATTFTSVQLYNGDSGTGYTNCTTEAGTEDGVAFEVMDSIQDYLYVGLATTFGGISIEWQDRGSNYTNDYEYWNGTIWTTLDRSGYTFVDDTSNFESDGRIYWDIPANWATKTVNSVASTYWVRIKTTTTPVTVAKAYLIQPANSVLSLLKLSSSEILNEEWAWCSYTTAVYVTIRNDGTAAYEGNAFLKSSSSSINKQNFFISNHSITLDHLDSTY